MTPGQLIKTINDLIKSELVPQKEFFQDMDKMYLSRFLVDMLRAHYTEKERKKLVNRKNSSQNYGECEPDWPICLENIVKTNYYHKSPSFYIYRESSLLSNFKPNHFKNNKRLKQEKYKKDRGSFRNTLGLELAPTGRGLDLSHSPREDIKTAEDQLLIDRSIHMCKHGDPAQHKREVDNNRRKLKFLLGKDAGETTTKEEGRKRRNSLSVGIKRYTLADESPKEDFKREAKKSSDTNPLLRGSNILFTKEKEKGAITILM